MPATRDIMAFFDTNLTVSLHLLFYVNHRMLEI